MANEMTFEKGKHQNTLQQQHTYHPGPSFIVCGLVGAAVAPLAP